MSSRPSTPPWHQTDLVRILIGETISEVGSAPLHFRLLPP